MTPLAVLKNQDFKVVPRFYNYTERAGWNLETFSIYDGNWTAGGRSDISSHPARSNETWHRFAQVYFSR